MEIIKCLFLIILLQISYRVLSQNYQSVSSYSVIRSEEGIEVDGVLDEEVWSQAEKGGGFFQSYPSDNLPAIDSTQFMVTYDDQFIYVGIICYDYLEGKPITNTLRRDFVWPRNDNISFYIDPYNDKSNGFTFQVTPDNVQREGLVVLGGNVQDDWDNKWYSGVSKFENGWTAEMAIPFKSIRYNSVPYWNIQLIRNNQKRNERTTWIHVPQPFRASDMTYTGQLAWDTPPPEAGQNLAFIPYISGRRARDFEENESETNGDVGFDAKIGLSNSLNLDLTFNPDFSQVEVDQQVTNLQRFEISFPERRQFFLENQDLFAQNGFPPSRPFFSRRIGIQGSGSTQRNVPILGGARLSGKIGQHWRIGALNMVTGEDKTSEEISPAQNYSVAVVERQIFRRSRVSAVFVGRTNLGTAALDSFRVDNVNGLIDEFGNAVKPADTLRTLSRYNYVYGLDYNLATVNNRWEGNFYYHRSTDPDKKEEAQSYGAFLRYQTTRINARAFFRNVGEGYNAEVGFVPRTDVMIGGGRIDLNYFTEGMVQRHGPSIGGNVLYDTDGNKLDDTISANYEVQFLNTSAFWVEVENQTIKLTDPFDPSRTDGEELPEGTSQNWTTISLSYQSDNRKPFTYDLGVSRGGFYNGERFNIETNLIYRSQPIAQFGINAEFNRITLPNPYNDADLFLIGPRLDLTLSNKVFWTTFIQYNTQDDNFGHNSRFQWRFKPVSDLFIVYTDNYLTPAFNTRNRALVIKLSYWLNL